MTGGQPASPLRRGTAAVAWFGQLADEVKTTVWASPLFWTTLIGLLAVVAFALQRPAPLKTIAVGILASLAAFASGGIIGFLFGIPRALQSARPGGGAIADLETLYEVNTNLEQVSDWLTKIIISLGLVQLTKIPRHFMSAASYVATAFDGESIPPSYAALALLFFGITGFMACYLWTRLILTMEFARADRAARRSPEFYEGLLEALLYQPAPKGFTSALEIGTEFLKRYGEGNWRVWRSLACSYGQQYKYGVPRTGADAAEMRVARDQALSAVRQVHDLALEEYDSMERLWNPKHVTPGENDLVVFADDPDFIELFRKWRAELDASHAGDRA